jgi:hypothetical protein
MFERVWNSRSFSSYPPFSSSSIGCRGGEKSDLQRVSFRLSWHDHPPYRTPLSSSMSVVSLLTSHQGATLPFGGNPQNSVSWRCVRSRMSLCCSSFMAVGFS